MTTMETTMTRRAARELNGYQQRTQYTLLKGSQGSLSPATLALCEVFEIPKRKKNRVPFLYIIQYNKMK